MEQLAIFSQEGLTHLFRWGHFVFGVIWIGMLYYFNFVQTPYFAEADGGTKSNMIQKVVPRALWWFRWGAMFTFLTGVVLLYKRALENGGHASFGTAWGLLILTGALLGTIMFLNVWLIIWPAQKIVIASTTAVAQGGKADPTAAARGARAGVASRTNTLLSIPMLFFMGAAPHLPIYLNPDRSLTPLIAILAVIIGAIELNAIKGKLGMLATVKGVTTCGVALTVVLYGLIEFLTK